MREDQIESWRVLTLDTELLNRDGTSHWIRRTSEECAALCWARILHYLEEADAPRPNTRLIAAFRWPVEKNRRAYVSFTRSGAVMFDYDYECTMGESAARFLRKLNAPYCGSLWPACRMWDRRMLREYSAVLDPAADRAGVRRGGDHA